MEVRARREGVRREGASGSTGKRVWGRKRHAQKGSECGARVLFKRLLRTELSCPPRAKKEETAKRECTNDERNGERRKAEGNSDSADGRPSDHHPTRPHGPLPAPASIHRKHRRPASASTCFDPWDALLLCSPLASRLGCLCSPLWLSTLRSPLVRPSVFCPLCLPRAVELCDDAHTVRALHEVSNPLPLFLCHADICVRLWVF